MAVAEHPKGVGHLGKYFFKSSDMPHPTTGGMPLRPGNETPETRRFSGCGFVFLVDISLEFDRFAAR